MARVSWLQAITICWHPSLHTHCFFLVFCREQECKTEAGPQQHTEALVSFIAVITWFVSIFKPSESNGATLRCCNPFITKFKPKRAPTRPLALILILFLQCREIKILTHRKIKRDVFAKVVLMHPIERIPTKSLTGHFVLSDQRALQLAHFNSV